MDTIIWQKFREGDRSAFHEMYNQYIDLLFGYGMKLSKDKNAVTECIQSLFIYLWEKRSSLNTPSNITGYLMTSLKNRIVKELGVKPRLKLVNADISEMQVPYSFDMEIDVQETLTKGEVDNEQMTALAEGLNKLSPRQREVIYLRYYKNLSISEVAAIMDINTQSVKNMTVKAIECLRKSSRVFDKASLMILLYELLGVLYNG